MFQTSLRAQTQHVKTQWFKSVCMHIHMHMHARMHRHTQIYCATFINISYQLKS